MKISTILLVTAFPLISLAQRSKVQAAWRALNDYEATMNENPELQYLTKAKESINLATADESTKNQAKTYAYKCRIAHAIYQYNFKQEQKKLESTITDKNARTEAAYSTAPLADFEEAVVALEKVKELDPKYFQSVMAITNTSDSPMEDDLKLNNVAAQIRLESSNIAVGKYRAKDFDASADYFYKSASINYLMTGKKDTSSYYNACISSQKAKNTAKMIEYNQKMIDQKMATPYNYQTIFDAKIALNDLKGAQESLLAGRKEFPNDVYLMNRETESYLQNGEQEKAIGNLQKAIEKEPNNAQLELVLGNVYDNLANPKGKSGKDTLKPTNYDELINNAASHYQKAVDLKPTNTDSYFNALYNLGALYNNYGATLYNKAMEKRTLTDLAAKKQSDYELQSNQYYKKAIPYLEQALSIKTDDKNCLIALRKLYLLTGNEAKGKEMQDKLKGK